MRAVILSIGDELLIGQVINTNASYLGERLLSIGIPAEKIITLSDNKKDIKKTFTEALGEYEVIIVTGGLGPTHDDITKKCIAEFFGVKLVEDRKVLSDIQSIFRRRKMKPLPVVRQQALVPVGCKVLYNKVGTAPGMLFEKKGKIFVAMPGVPHEVYYIWEKHMEPYLKKKLFELHEKDHINIKTIHTIGISESVLSQKIGSVDVLNNKYRNSRISLAFLPSNFEVRLRFTVKAKTKETARKVMRSIIRHVRNNAGEYVYSYKAERQTSVIGRLLSSKKLMLAVAESCTGGLIASKITDAAGSSDYFLEGVVAYANKSKTDLLGVKKITLKKYGAVSEQTAIEMAEGMRKRAGSDIAVSTTGIAGPSGAAKGKPVGLVWIGYADKRCAFAKKFIFVKDRSRNKEIMSKMTLEVLRRQLLEIK